MGVGKEHEKAFTEHLATATKQLELGVEVGLDTIIGKLKVRCSGR